MTRSTHRRLADGICALTLLLLSGGAALTLAATGDVVDALVTGTAYALGFAVVGWLLWRRLPGNPIGWCFAGSALSSSVGSLAHGWVAQSQAGQLSPGRLAVTFALIDAYGWVLSITLGACLPLLLLPDGRLPSPSWRLAPWLLLAGCGLGLVGRVTRPGPIGTGPLRDLVNPYGLSGLGSLPELLSPLDVVSVLAATGAGIVALAVRYRRAHGMERQQLRWVVLGGCVALAGASTSANQPYSALGVVAGVVAANALPVCIGVAVLRYHLYDLGRIVSRTVSYAIVTAVLLGLYAAGVTGAARLAPSSSSLAVAASTLAVAALFQPLRHRVQSAVDHRFNRDRYDADRTVEAFSQRLRSQVDLESVRTDLLSVVDGALQPRSAGLWLRDAR